MFLTNNFALFIDRPPDLDDGVNRQTERLECNLDGLSDEAAIVADLKGAECKTRDSHFKCWSLNAKMGYSKFQIILDFSSLPQFRTRSFLLFL